jgi:DNA-binding MarR family transcriptional regulator
MLTNRRVMDKGESNAQQLMQAFYRIARSRHALFQDLLHRYDVTLHQFHLLLYMKMSGNIKVTDLSEKMLVSKPTASRMINTLSDKGMVKKRADDRDRRLVFIVLTSKGERVVEEVQARQRELLSRVLGKMPASEMKVFLETLERIEGELAAIAREEAGGGGKG